MTLPEVEKMQSVSKVDNKDESTVASCPVSPSFTGLNSSHSNVSELLLDPAQQRFPALSGEAYNDLPTYPLRPSYRDYHFSLRPLSRPVVFDGCPDNPHKPTSVPIYQTATFEQPSSSEFGAYDYTRSGNPTRTALEKQAAMLEYAHAAFAFSTGMAALSCVTRLVRPGETLLLTSDIYGGMYRLVDKVTKTYGVNVIFLPTWDLDVVRQTLRELSDGTQPGGAPKLLHMESPSNPLMRISDIKALSLLCHEYDCLLSIDNTMMTPHLQQPINHGADLVVHSMTKFFGGHSDTMGGIVAVAYEDLAKRISFFQNAEGSGLGPFDCWLFLRGIKTMALRVEKAQENASQIAAFLMRQIKVIKDVYYAGLQPSQEQMKNNSQPYRDFKIHSGQCSGGGSLLSFITGNVQTSKQIIDSLRLFKITVSFGSCNSLVEMPAYLSHASIPEEERTLPEDLIRLSIGIEDINDLIDDLQQAISIVVGLKNGNGHIRTIVPVKKLLHKQASLDFSKRTKPELPKYTPKATAFNSQKEQHKSSIQYQDGSITFRLNRSFLNLIAAFAMGLLLSAMFLKITQQS